MLLLFSAFFISLIVTLLTIYLSHKYNIFIDESCEKRPQNFHKHIVPRAGGIGILVAIFLIVKVTFGIKLLLSIILAFISGILEDYHNSLTPIQRLLLQLFAALIAVILTNSVITYLGLGVTLPYWAGVIFSIFAIVGMMNAINIIDGFNGLASGIVVSILLSFLYVSGSQNSSEIYTIITITLGATFGFFVLNYPKGKIFLGDGGAYMLGFIVAVIGIFLAGKYESVSPWYILATFIYPVWEVLFSIIRKKTIGLSPMQPDRYHIHMLIYRNITNNNPLTATFILLANAPFFILSAINAHCSICNVYIVLVFIVLYLILYFYLYKKDKKSIP